MTMSVLKNISLKLCLLTLSLNASVIQDGIFSGENGDDWAVSIIFSRTIATGPEGARDTAFTQVYYRESGSWETFTTEIEKATGIGHALYETINYSGKTAILAGRYSPLQIEMNRHPAEGLFADQAGAWSGDLLGPDGTRPIVAHSASAIVAPNGEYWFFADGDHGRGVANDDGSFSATTAWGLKLTGELEGATITGQVKGVTRWGESIHHTFALSGGESPYPEHQIESPRFFSFADLWTIEDSWPWCWREDLGWFYVHSETTASIWIYHPTLGWFWTSENAWPWLYTHQSKSWSYWIEGTRWIHQSNVWREF